MDVVRKSYPNSGRIVALSLLVSLVLAAIVAIPPVANAQTPTLAILGPLEGSSVFGNSTALNLSIGDFILNEAAIGGAPVEGEGHYHVYVNGVLYGHFVDLNMTLGDLPEGSVNVRVDLRENNHAELVPPVRDDVNLLVLYPRIGITEPENNTIVYGGVVPLSVDIENVTMAAAPTGLPNVPGRGHYDIFVDDVLLGSSVDPEMRVTGIDPGLHDLRVELKENDGTPYTPLDNATDNITMTLVEELPRLTIVSPLEGTTWYGNMVNLTMDVENFTLIEPGTPGSAGEGFILLYVNGTPFQQTTELNLTMADAGPGNYSIMAELRNFDNTTVFPAANDTVNFTVVSGVPEMRIVSPENDTIWYGGAAAVAVDVRNFTLDGASIGMENEDSVGHIAVFVDGVFKMNAASAGFIVNGMTTGTHNITLEVRSNSMVPIQPLVSDSVVVSVIAEEPKIRILSPPDMAVVPTSGLNLRLAVENFTLSQSQIGGEAVPGTGHYQLIVDGSLLGSSAMLNRTITGLAPGMHNITVQLRHSDNTMLNGLGQFSDNVTVMVSTGARPNVTIESPRNGSFYYRTEVTVVISATEFTPGFTGFVRAFLDNESMGSFNATMFNLTDVGAGTHNLIVELFSINGSAYVPPVRDSVIFNVSDLSPAIEIQAPENGTFHYGTNVRLLIDVTDFELNKTVEGNASLEGRGYYVVYVNGTEAMNGTAVQAIVPVELGNNTIMVQLVGIDGEPIEPNASALVNVTVLPLPVLTITSPANGSTVTPPFNMTVTVTNFILTAQPGTAPIEGQGRIRVLVDGKVRGNFSNTTIPITTLTPGSHNITVQLVNVDLTPIVTNVLRTIRVTVQGGGGGGEENITITFGPVRFEGEPIKDATIKLSFEGSSREGKTGSNGIATLTVPASWKGENVSYRITADGYKTLEGKGTIGDDLVFDAEEALDLEEDDGDDDGDDSWIIILIIAIIAIIIIIALLIFVFSRGREEHEDTHEVEEGESVHMGEDIPETDEEHEAHMAEESEEDTEETRIPEE